MYGRTVHLAFRVYGLLVQPLYGFAVHLVRFECTTFLIFGRTARTLPRSISGSLWWGRGGDEPERADVGQMLQGAVGVDEAGAQRHRHGLEFVGHDPRPQLGAAQFTQDMVGKAARRSGGSSAAPRAQQLALAVLDRTQGFGLGCRDVLLDHTADHVAQYPRPPHDLRRTFSTTVAGLGFGRDALNRVTNHKEGGVAARIMSLVEGRTNEKIVQLRR